MTIMKTYIVMRILLGMIICISGAAHAKSEGEALLRRAVRCLTVKEFLPSIKAQKQTFGYLIDETSYPGKKMLYVVNYSDRSRPDGSVFIIFLAKHNGRWDMRIQNNASFRLANDGDEGISFASPPLGGAWTQEHLVAAIKKIEKQPKFTISVQSPPTIDSSVSCGSYTDPQPKRSTK